MQEKLEKTNFLNWRWEICFWDFLTFTQLLYHTLIGFCSNVVWLLTQQTSMKFIRLSRKSWWKRGTWENNCCTARPLFGKINTRWYVKEVPRGHRFLRLFYVWNGWSQILNLVSHSALFIRSLSRIFRLIFAWLCNQCKNDVHHISLKNILVSYKTNKQIFPK